MELAKGAEDYAAVVVCSTAAVRRRPLCKTVVFSGRRVAQESQALPTKLRRDVTGVPYQIVALLRL